MRMIAGFISPSAGQVSVCGHDIERAPVQAKSCMGYLPEGAPSYGEMTVSEFLDFVADVRGLTGELRRRRGAVSSSTVSDWGRSSIRSSRRFRRAFAAASAWRRR